MYRCIDRWDISICVLLYNICICIYIFICVCERERERRIYIYIYRRRVHYIYEEDFFCPPPPPPPPPHHHHHNFFKYRKAESTASYIDANSYLIRRIYTDINDTHNK